MKNYFHGQVLKFSRLIFLMIASIMLFSGTLIASEGNDQDAKS